MPHKPLSLELPKGQSSSKESRPASAAGGECELLSRFQKSKAGFLASVLGANPRVHRPSTWGLPPSSLVFPQGYLQLVPDSVLSEMGTQIIFLGVEVFSLPIHTLFFDIFPNSNSNFSSKPSATCSQFTSLALQQVKSKDEYKRHIMSLQLENRVKFN